MNNIREKPTLLKHIEDCHEDGAVEVSAVEVINKHLPCVITASSNSQQLKFWHWECNDAGYGKKELATKKLKIPFPVTVYRLKTLLTIHRYLEQLR